MADGIGSINGKAAVSYFLLKYSRPEAPTLGYGKKFSKADSSEQARKQPKS